MKKTIFLILWPFVVLVALGGWFFHSKFHRVDHRPAIAVAEQYYSVLAGKSQARVSSFYSRDFLADNEEIWRQLIMGLNQQFGPVTEAKLMEARIVPIDQIGCSLLRYEVHRGRFVTREELILKPAAGQSALIVGHEVLRLDTGQRIAAGVGVREQKVFSVP